MTKRNEIKVNVLSLKAGDVFWFSGYWVTFTRFANGKVMASWPHSPKGKDTSMMYCPIGFVTEHLVTLKISPAV